MLLNIEREAAPAGITVLKLTGRITLGNSCQELEWEIDKLVGEGSKGVVLDLSRIDRVDSAGLGILTLSAGKLRKAGGQLKLAGAQRAVDDVVKLTRIDTIVSCYPDLDSALRAFGSGTSAAQA